MTIDNTALFLDGKQINLRALIVEQMAASVPVLPRDGHANYVLRPVVTVLHCVSEPMATD